MKLQQTKDGQLFLNLRKAIANANSWKKGDDLELFLDQRGQWVLKKIN